MDTIGIRELRQRASEFLRRVQAGETFEVTDRGRPVALLTPVPTASPYEAMVASGDIDVADADMTSLPAPLELKPGEAPPSETLERLRSDER